MLDTNLTGAYRVAKRAVRGMMRKRRGRIVLVSSVVGLLGSAGPDQLRGVQGRTGRLRPVPRPRAGLAQHHRQRRRAGFRRHRHDGGPGRGPAGRRSPSRIPLGRIAAPEEVAKVVRVPGRRRTPPTSPAPSSRSTADSEWGTEWAFSKASGSSSPASSPTPPSASTSRGWRRSRAPTVVLTGFGRMSLVAAHRQAAPRSPPPVLELDVTNARAARRPGRPGGRARRRARRRPALDRVRAADRAGRQLPEHVVGGRGDRRAGLGVLAQVAHGGLPAADEGPAARSSGSTSTPPWRGRCTTGWAWPRPAWSRPPATWPSTSARRASASTWSPRARSARWPPRASRASSEFDRAVAGAGAARLGRQRPEPDREGLRGAAVGLVPGHDGRDRARRRRSSRGRLISVPRPYGGCAVVRSRRLYGQSSRRRRRSTLRLSAATAPIRPEAVATSAGGTMSPAGADSATSWAGPWAVGADPGTTSGSCGAISGSAGSSWEDSGTGTFAPPPTGSGGGTPTEPPPPLAGGAGFVAGFGLGFGLVSRWAWAWVWRACWRWPSAASRAYPSRRRGGRRAACRVCIRSPRSRPSASPPTPDRSPRRRTRAPRPTTSPTPHRRVASLVSMPYRSPSTDSIEHHVQGAWPVSTYLLDTERRLDRGR